MKKVIFFTALISFYLLTQMNFTLGDTNKSCNDLKQAVRSCEKLLNDYKQKLKGLEPVSKKSLDYSVAVTSQNSSYMRDYENISRSAQSVSENSQRAPASVCLIQETAILKNCLQEAKKIYTQLVP
jgi:hypothetical protein